MAPCPAHEDRSPSLSIREDPSGKILVHCFSGCRQSDVITALKGRGLWPEKPRQLWTEKEKTDWGQQRQKAEKLAARATAWSMALCRSLESKKRWAFEHMATEPSWFWSWIDVSGKLYLLESHAPQGRVAAYLQALKDSPAETDKWTRIGRRQQREDLAFGSLVVAMLATAEK